MTLGYVTLGVILSSFFIMSAWDVGTPVDGATIVWIIILILLALAGAPVVIIVSLILLVVCLRYLVHDRLGGRQRIVAIVTSVASVALAVICGIFFFTTMRNV